MSLRNEISRIADAGAALSQVLNGEGAVRMANRFGFADVAMGLQQAPAFSAAAPKAPGLDR